MVKIIEMKDYAKKYGDLTAVDHISFDVEKGSLFAFLGPNGAGKTTTINSICTVLPQTSGIIKIGGFEIGKEDDKIRSIIGVVFQDSILDNLLTVKENLKFRSTFYNMTDTEFENRLKEITDVTGISEFLNRRYGKLSGGQRRRADIARALINKPQILFLDEPTTGLDPQTRMKVWGTIKKLQDEEHITIFLTTHYMEEAAGADDVVIIDHGKIVAQGTPDQLRLKYSNDMLKIIPKSLDEFLKRLDKEYTIKNEVVQIPIKNSLEGLALLKKYEPEILSFEVVRGTMDDVFVNITGTEIR